MPLLPHTKLRECKNYFFIYLERVEAGKRRETLLEATATETNNKEEKKKDNYHTCM